MNIYSIHQQQAVVQVTDEDWVVMINDEIDSLPEVATCDFTTPEMIGEMDALDDFPFAPEVYFVRHADKCRYATGWVTVKGPSYLTDGFLVASEVEAIEDDRDFIRGGC